MHGTARYRWHAAPAMRSSSGNLRTRRRPVRRGRRMKFNLLPRSLDAASASCCRQPLGKLFLDGKALMIPRKASETVHRPISRETFCRTSAANTLYCPYRAVLAKFMWHASCTWCSHICLCFNLEKFGSAKFFGRRPILSFFLDLVPLKAIYVLNALKNKQDR